jgi:hypothetical protein
LYRKDTEMRHATIALGTGLCIGLHQIACAPPLDEQASLATELRCEGQKGRLAEGCRELHEKLYQAGTLDPEKSLRDYCTPVRTKQRVHRRPPEVCVERFGGWRHG